jgi:hypothetical protein
MVPCTLQLHPRLLRRKACLAMESIESSKSPQKALPDPPSPDSQATKRNGCHFPPPRSTARPRQHDSKSESAFSTRAVEIRTLEEQNQAFKKELVKNYKLQVISEQLVEEVRGATEQLRKAVLKWRNDQKSIDAEFSESNQF